MNLIGKNIRAERKRQLLTIEQLSEKAGITENFLGKIERGEGIPSLRTFDAVASALGVGMDYLCAGEGERRECALIKTLIELNSLSADAKDKFMEFISCNISFFK